MLTFLTPLHTIAVRRGDGLRSELAGSLKWREPLLYRIRRVEDVTRTGQQGRRRTLVRRLLG